MAARKEDPLWEFLRIQQQMDQEVPKPDRQDLYGAFDRFKERPCPETLEAFNQAAALYETAVLLYPIRQEAWLNSMGYTIHQQEP